jgi:hypothetical protein
MYTWVQSNYGQITDSSLRDGNAKINFNAQKAQPH